MASPNDTAAKRYQRHFCGLSLHSKQEEETYFTYPKPKQVSPRSTLPLGVPLTLRSSRRILSAGISPRRAHTINGLENTRTSKPHPQKDQRWNCLLAGAGIGCQGHLLPQMLPSPASMPPDSKEPMERRGCKQN